MAFFSQYKQFYSKNSRNRPLPAPFNPKNLFFDRIKPIIELIVIVFGVIIGIGQLRYLGKQIAAQSKQIAEQNIWTKRNVTFQYLQQYTGEMDKIANQLKELPNTTNLRSLLNDNNYRASIMNLVAYFDDLAIGIERNYFDEEIAQESFIPETLAIHEKLEKLGYFELRKKEMGADVAVHFQNLVKKWRHLNDTVQKSVSQ